MFFFFSTFPSPSLPASVCFSSWFCDTHIVINLQSIQAFHRGDPFVVLYEEHNAFVTVIKCIQPWPAVSSNGLCICLWPAGFTKRGSALIVESTFSHCFCVWPWHNTIPIQSERRVPMFLFSPRCVLRYSILCVHSVQCHNNSFCLRQPIE